MTAGVGPGTSWVAYGAHAPVTVTSKFGGRPKGLLVLVEADDSAMFRFVSRGYSAEDDALTATAEDSIVDKG